MKSKNPIRRLASLLALALAPGLNGQTAPATGATGSEENPITLSPFSVTATKDQGYLASSTLAGSRLNTSLVDTPASISVMTSEFIADIGATNVADALAYARDRALQHARRHRAHGRISRTGRHGGRVRTRAVNPICRSCAHGDYLK